MFLSFLSHVLSAWFAFLIPVFGTYKALSHRPVSEPELERWAMYWSVMGLITAYQYLGEFLISWLPFYWEVKTLFLLWLALPQTQGSTFIYQMYLEPFFRKNEVELDADVASINAKTFAFLQDRLAALWQIVLGLINKGAAQQQATGAPGQAPASGGLNMDSAMNMLRTFGPSVMSAFQPAPASASAPSPAPSAHPQRGFKLGEHPGRRTSRCPSLPRTPVCHLGIRLPCLDHCLRLCRITVVHMVVQIHTSFYVQINPQLVDAETPPPRPLHCNPGLPRCRRNTEKSSSPSTR
ncbi:Protein YOP1 [Mycena sanguinolenta]|uniref:Protein YOP1 n=1 Tax=Mycena sanguinolenta TaxID=230812 RepID=A0A8H6XDZ6_9AGAR|nr:Protein YOP1 [Mycena sanguinolenta]